MGLEARVRRLEALGGAYAGGGILETSLGESGLPAPTWHWRRALARATPEELAQL